MSPAELSELVFAAVKAHPAGASLDQVVEHLARALGQGLRRNHVGIYLRRHQHADRLDERGGVWRVVDRGSAPAPTTAPYVRSTRVLELRRPPVRPRSRRRTRP
jgi:hypothetical protein